jgi:hypothetical protein
VLGTNARSRKPIFHLKIHGFLSVANVTEKANRKNVCLIVNEEVLNIIPVDYVAKVD